MIYKTTPQIMGFDFPYIKSVDTYSPLQGNHFKQAIDTIYNKVKKGLHLIFYLNVKLWNQIHENLPPFPNMAVKFKNINGNPCT